MSLWYDKKGKSYASKGSSSWVKYYAEHLISVLKEELLSKFTRHYNGTEGKHKAEHVMYDDTTSVKSIILSNQSASNSQISALETALTTGLNTKVDKEGGKGLSSNDFTDEEKSKLSKGVLAMENLVLLGGSAYYSNLKECLTAASEWLGENAFQYEVYAISGKAGNDKRSKLVKLEYPGQVLSAKMTVDFTQSGSKLRIFAHAWSESPEDTGDYVLYKTVTLTSDDVGTTYTPTLAFSDWIPHVLGTKNNMEYTPTSDYHPATKKYVDDTAEKPENKGRAGGYAPLDENGKIPDSYLYGVTVKQYGVRWNGTSSTVCERLGDAVGLVANAHKGTADSVQNDFDSIYPWSDMKLCNIDADGNILAFADEPSFQRDGTNGDVMVRIPKFYYKREKTADGCEEWWICAVKLPGYALHPLFMDDGKEVSEVFHSAYNASSYTDEADSKVKLQSITGVQPRTRTTIANFRTYARNKGSIWGIEDISCINALQLLYMVEYANTNSQSVLGSGVSLLQYTSHLAVEAGENTNEFVTSTGNANKYAVGQRIEIGKSQGENNITSTPRTITAITAREDDADISVITFDGDPVTSIAVGNMIWNVAPLNGSCDELGGGSGYIGANGYSDVAYRGIECFHAKLLRFIDGVNIKDRVVYYANSMADYADGVYDGKYRAVGYSNAEASGYISTFGYDEKAPWVMFPIEAKGGSTTCVPDYYYQNTGERLLLLGGPWADGAAAGAFFFGCSRAFSNSNLYCGAHLLVKKP